MVVTAALVWLFNLGRVDIATLGTIGSGCPPSDAGLSPGLIRELVLPPSTSPW